MQLQSLLASSKALSVILGKPENNSPVFDTWAACPDDGKRLRACEKRLELLLRAKPKIGGFGGRHREGWRAGPDDGKHLRACEKRLELQEKAKPKIRSSASSR